MSAWAAPEVWDRELQLVTLAVVLVLGSLTVLAWALGRRVTSEAGRAAVANLRSRAYSYWVIVLVLVVAILSGERGTLLLFALVSLLALREYLRLTHSAAGHRRTVLATYLFFLPFQYVLIGMDWYGFYSIFIPVYAFLFVPIMNAVAGDPDHFLARTAITQWGLMVCIYSISYAPALLTLSIPGYEGQGAKLLVWFLVVVQISDFLQYASGKLLGRHPIAPTISPKKTWEGFLFGVAGASLIGAGLWWLTPYSPLTALLAAFAAALLGFAGGLTMSAIKRDHHVKDFGALLPGHGGVLDRVDSVCFSAPVVFHITRYFFAR